MGITRLLTLRKARIHIPPGYLLWGVRRRSEMDDSRAHDRLTQHAFIAGNDVRALCGFRPFRWRGPAVPLIFARDSNPQCRSCLTVVRDSVSAEDQEAAPIPQLAAALALIEAPEEPVARPPIAASRRARRNTGRSARTKPRRDVAKPALAEWPPIIAGP